MSRVFLNPPHPAYMHDDNAKSQWFDRDKATPYEEETRHDGNNFISVATGSQWEHEKLYKTASENWVFHSWSQWQSGNREVYELIPFADAVKWLVKNGHDLGDIGLTAALLAEANELISGLEV